MAFIIWSDDFLTGIDVVDRQHRKLVDMINDAAPSLLDCRPGKEAERETLFGALLDYTGYHFQTEESLMAERGVDPRVLAHHRRTHAQLVDEVRARRAAFDCLEPLSGQRMLGFLAAWLLYHVLGEDQTMGRQIKAIDAGKPAGEAFEQDGGARLAPDDSKMSRLVVRLYTEMSGQIHEISQHSRQLDDLVSDRTAELEATLRALGEALQAAETANEAKRRFLGIVSHELRTPMNAIVGFTEVLRHQAVTPAERGLSQQILDAATHLQEMIDGLIDFSRDEAGKQVVFKLATLLESSCRRAFAAARKKGLVAELKLDPALPAALQGDGRRIGLVVRQLVDNAVKFTSAGGVRVRAERLPPAPPGDSAGKEGVLLRISVTDNGIGILPDQLSHLFEAFYQADDSATRKHGGIGIGLALASHAAQLMGGELGVKSVPGKGSCFWLDLRLLPAEVSELEDVRLSSAPGESQASSRLPADEPDTAAFNLSELTQWLRESDTRAADVVARESAALRQLLGNDFETFATHVANFESVAALAILERAIGKTHPGMRE